MMVSTKGRYALCGGVVAGLRGKGGGYRLEEPPERYAVGRILRLTERDLAPVACLEQGAQPCLRVENCRTLPMWQKLDARINGFFDGITIADLMEKRTAKGGRA